MHEVISDLCSDHDPIPLMPESLGYQFFAPPIAVGICGVVQSYAQIQGMSHPLPGLVVAKSAPPGRRERTEPTSDFADGQIGVAISTVFHCDDQYVLVQPRRQSSGEPTLSKDASPTGAVADATLN